MNLPLLDFECLECGTAFQAKRANASYCSPRCRSRASRARTGPPPLVVTDPQVKPDAVPVPDPPLVQRIRASLEAVDKHETWEGEMALAAAAKIAAAGTTTAQTATLMKELKATMAELTRTATPAADGRRPGVAVRGRWRNRLDDDAA